MLRPAPHAGALYSCIARGLGPPAGVGAGWPALGSYRPTRCGNRLRRYGDGGRASSAAAAGAGSGCSTDPAVIPARTDGAKSSGRPGTSGLPSLLGQVAATPLSNAATAT